MGQMKAWRLGEDECEGVDGRELVGVPVLDEESV